MSARRTATKPAPAFVDPTTFTPHFAWRSLGEARRVRRGGRDEIYCENVLLSDAAEKYGTPTYLYSSAAITDAYRELDRGLHGVPHTLCFAVKSNGNLAILERLAKLGSGFDIVSGGELYRLGQIGVPGKRIVFSGVGKTREEIREALQYRATKRTATPGILLFNVESEAELEILLEESQPRRSSAVVRRPRLRFASIPMLPPAAIRTFPRAVTIINSASIGPTPNAFISRIKPANIFAGRASARTSDRKSSHWILSATRFLA